ncbi:MAG: cell division protein FtsH [Candidatus Sungbacteria bacterium RIFCSPLOWO2_01_FULL_47_32]|uniref:ATP-dependent zinc metalloprotease FtsH n=1 Tax=Candidatus Sungbacteria bacterium RIFCSPHIGHO2_01_FULL_47_32 TaxID=1802264 RepID=A0A1G2K7Z0_9BACT|nr:MAG: cell division protein FtsH [Candidatus Sungbacteria bacterium RIFCSPHIGHO2_01_FULL_47_32]OHA04995.1 MAG: cell division protein FtsH [Candidatus Sungbacteria bacterium RIFCSPLOWO2_01_FULL_47_32]
MKSISKNLTYGVLILMTIALLGSLFSDSLQEKKKVTLSELVQKINSDEVSKIVVRENNLEVTLNDKSILLSRKESESGLSETLKNYSVDTEKLKKVSIEIQEQSGFLFWIGAVLPFLLPILVIGFFIWWSARQLRQGSMQAFTFGQSRARLIMPNSKRERTTFKDVAGAKEAKEELKEIVDFLKSPKKFFDIGARIPRGVLLMGAPGTGKTLLAKAVAGEAGVPFYQMSGSEFVEMFVGVGASRVRDLFKLAKKSAPSIVFIDEIDAVGRHRGTGIGGGHDEREQTLNQILVEMDGFETNESVIVMAATNRPDVLDPALLRPGRFDRRVTIDLPDINDREEILKIHAKNKPLAKDVRFRMIAERTPGFAGADLANLVNEAAILAARKNQKIVNELDLIQSIEKVMLGPERKSHILSVKEKEISAYHEAGHALVAATLPNADPVHKISIVSRGRAAGYTLKIPAEDRHLFSRSNFLDELAVSLGGYVAEKVVFNEITTGAGDDLKKASDIARSLVMRYGMSEKLGPAVFGGEEEMVFLGKEFGHERNYSEQIAELIDSEVRKTIDGAYKRAREIITSRRNKLEKIAKHLIEKETIEKDEFAAMMAAA